MTIDRTKAPALETIQDIEFFEPEIHYLDNGVKVYVFKTDTTDIIKTDLVFDSGSLHSENKLVASSATNLLLMGAEGKNEEDIASEFDYYGAFYSKTSNYTDSTITFYCLAKHSDTVYDLMARYLDNAEFNQNDLDVYKLVKIQNLQVSKQKTAFMARRQFNRAVFGNHPYGFTAEEADYEALKKEDLENFYRQSKKLKYIILAGGVTKETLWMINTCFKRFEARQLSTPTFEYTPETNKIWRVPKEGSVQTTVRLGFRTVNRLQPDYQLFGIMVTMLGGFFGSRLMKNIREEKGYTYGIHSSLWSLPDAGVFSIQTDVNKEVYEDTIREIFKEINRLKDEPLGEEELDILKNYSLGSFLRSIDGPFAVSEKYKTLIDYGQDYNYYHNYIRLLKNLDTNGLMETARKYLKQDEIYQVVAGV